MISQKVKNYIENAAGISPDDIEYLQLEQYTCPKALFPINQSKDEINIIEKLSVLLNPYPKGTFFISSITTLHLLQRQTPFDDWAYPGKYREGLLRYELGSWRAYRFMVLNQLQNQSPLDDKYDINLIIVASILPSR